MRPHTPERVLMKVARFSTIGFGLLAILIALLIPLMGGIVNVVISVAALTGVPLYLPLIWSLFSKRLNGQAMLYVTLISLAVNALFKFITPYTLGFALDRAGEMLVGVLVPMLLLIAYEGLARLKNYPEKSFPVYKPKEFSSDGKQENKFSVRVIGWGAMISGSFISVLGILADENRWVPLCVGMILLLIGLGAYKISKK